MPRQNWRIDAFSSLVMVTEASDAYKTWWLNDSFRICGYPAPHGSEGKDEVVVWGRTYKEARRMVETLKKKAVTR